MTPTHTFHRILFGAALLAALLTTAGTARAGDEIRVTVVVILGSTDPKAKTDPELEEVAKELKKKDKTLQALRVGTTTIKSVPVGGKEKFPLTEDEVVIVFVMRGLGEDERVQLKIKPPGIKEIHYSCCCGKYFPVMTNIYTKDKKRERVIVAVCADPCQVKK